MGYHDTLSILIRPLDNIKTIFKNTTSFDVVEVPCPTDYQFS